MRFINHWIALNRNALATTRPPVSIVVLAVATVAVVTVLLGLQSVTQPTQVALAGTHEVLEPICADFGIPAEDCDGALNVYTDCAIGSSYFTTPESSLTTYGEYLDLDYIYNNFPDDDGDGLGDLLTTRDVPGYIKLLFMPNGGMNIVCEFDVSSLMLEGHPGKALVTEFICGPDFDPATVGTSRLTPNGKLKVNCHWDEITW